MQEEVLRIENLKKYFSVGLSGTNEQFVKAIDGVTFSLRRGETLGLVGESGSGKSTTAYNVLGMQKPTEGVIEFLGQDITMPLEDRPLSLKNKYKLSFRIRELR